MTAVTETKSKVWLAPSVDCQYPRSDGGVYMEHRTHTNDRSGANLKRSISASCAKSFSNYVARRTKLIICVCEGHKTEGRRNKILIIEERQQYAKKDHCPAQDYCFLFGDPPRRKRTPGMVAFVLLIAACLIGYVAHKQVEPNPHSALKKAVKRLQGSSGASKDNLRGGETFCQVK